MAGSAWSETSVMLSARGRRGTIGLQVPRWAKFGSTLYMTDVTDKVLVT